MCFQEPTHMEYMARKEFWSKMIMEQMGYA